MKKNMKRKGSLKIKLIVWICLQSILTILLIGAFNYYNTVLALKNNFKESNFQAIEKIENAIHYYIEGLRGGVNYFADRQIVKDYALLSVLNRKISLYIQFRNYHQILILRLATGIKMQRIA